MKVTKVAGNCKQSTCPAVYVDDAGSLVVQGAAVRNADGLQLGEGEQAVQISVELVREALRALDR
ncbi:hypothetical protein [Streptoalloteichus hindustanus]|uniref:Uncharacterized protein n=1 Tax=Streptoalloteichus hindustanus TaxID=2017 RepID=A0A1M5A9U7_STRHI|nr:hypothetical protein [Streptoalloteichus hindustanus]SHF26642.1 hypothetical protein SAMN05444320_10316 [Streptoalloteichus hindustanus]